MKLLKNYFFFILFSCTLLGQETRPQKKVVFIIVDGIAEDMLKKADIPNLKKIQKEGTFLKAYVGGMKEGYSETPTISAVGYNSLLTGTWVHKHHVYDNKIEAPNYNYPTIFKLFKTYYPNRKAAVFSTWEDNRTKLIGEGLPQTGNLSMDYAFDGMENDTLNFPHDNHSRYIRKIDSVVAGKAASYIRKDAPDLSWVYLQYTDDMGHRHGDSDALYNSISFEDRLIGQIYDAVNVRKTEYGEDWLFIVTTDHGRSEDNGRSHGGQSERERNTWIVVNKKDINSYAKNNRVAITDILPTMIDFLGIKVPESVQQEIDGIDLLNPVSAYDLSAAISGNNLKLTWKTTPGIKEEAEVLIAETNNFSNGGKDNYQSLGKIRLNKGTFESNLKNSGSHFYKIVLKTKNGFLNTWLPDTKTK